MYPPEPLRWEAPSQSLERGDDEKEHKVTLTILIFGWEKLKLHRLFLKITKGMTPNLEAS